MTIEFAGMSLEALDELFRTAKEEEGWTIIISINAYKKELIHHRDKNGNLVPEYQDRLMSGASKQIHSLQDIFRLFTGDEENKLMKLLDKRIRKKLR